MADATTVTAVNGNGPTLNEPHVFDFPVKFQGRTPHFNIYTSVDLNDTANAIARRVLERCEQDYSRISEFFGGLEPPHFNVIIFQGDTAHHIGCSGTDLYCGVALDEPDFTNMLLVSEEVEVFSDLQDRGWDCQKSNGEGLSRAIAGELYPQNLRNFVTAPRWLDGSQNRPDFISDNDKSDQDPQSIGCVVLFLNFLLHQLGFSWNQIVQAGACTPSGVFKKLTGQEKNKAFRMFNKVINASFPPGTPSNLLTDNPFPLP